MSFVPEALAPPNGCWPTTAPVGFDLDIDFDSPAKKEDQLRLMAAAKKGCFIETTLMQGLEVGHRLQIDGDWHDA